MFRPALEKVLQGCDGGIAAVLMGFDGIAVESVTRSPGFDVHTVGAEFSYVLGQIRKAVNLLNIGKLDEVSIRSERLTFVVRAVTDEYFLGLALGAAGNTGKGRYLARMAASNLRPHL